MTGQSWASYDKGHDENSPGGPKATEEVKRVCVEGRVEPEEFYSTLNFY